jgi:hypothetical protein
MARTVCAYRNRWLVVAIARGAAEPGSEFSKTRRAVDLLARFLNTLPTYGWAPISTRGDRVSMELRLSSMTLTGSTPWSNPSAKRVTIPAARPPPQCAQSSRSARGGYRRVRLRTPARDDPISTCRKSPREPECMGQIMTHDAANTLVFPRCKQGAFEARLPRALAPHSDFFFPPIFIRRRKRLNPISTRRKSPREPECMGQSLVLLREVCLSL